MRMRVKTIGKGRKCLFAIMLIAAALTGCGSQGIQTHTHNFVKEYWPSVPTCSSGGFYNLYCPDCGEEGGSGSDPALPHSPVTREEVRGNCSSPTILVKECGICGAELGRESRFENEHDWKTRISDPVWSDETGDFTVRKITSCSSCDICR